MRQQFASLARIFVFQGKDGVRETKGKIKSTISLGDLLCALSTRLSCEGALNMFVCMVPNFDDDIR